MALELSTAGVTLRYAVEATTGVRPTTGYTIIPNIKSIPDFNPEPSTIEVTDLSETEFRRYITGLKDLGSSIAFGMNHTDPFQDKWDDLYDEYETARDADLAMWFAVVVPGLSRSFYFIGQPAPLGLGPMEVGAAIESSVFITPNKVEGWAPKPT